MAVLVAAAAYFARALTPSGALAAALVGTAVLFGGGWAGGAVLAAFFLGSTSISRLSPDPSREYFDAKGIQRDGFQVLANGGPAAVGAMLAGWPCALHSAPCILHVSGVGMLTAGLAAAAADTWATSVGAWSPGAPRLITTGRPVPPGTSGALSWYGSGGALLGAATVGVVAALAFGSIQLLPFALVLGMAGMLLDSLLGAGIQARFQCPICETPSERPVHRCGARTVHLYGWRWCSNDIVNALSTGVAGLAGALLMSGK